MVGEGTKHINPSPDRNLPPPPTRFEPGQESPSREPERVRISPNLRESIPMCLRKTVCESQSDRRPADGSNIVLRHHKKSPRDALRTPSDAAKPPSDAARSPSDALKSPSDAVKSPSDGRKVSFGASTELRLGWNQQR